MPFAGSSRLRLQYRIEKNRLEALSDGVLAIIITIMVLELKVPHDSDLAAFKSLLSVLLTTRSASSTSASTGTIIITGSRTRTK
jgi:hypothetical protein